MMEVVTRQREYKKYTITVSRQDDEVIIRSQRDINVQIENGSKDEKERMYYVWKAFQRDLNDVYKHLTKEKVSSRRFKRVDAYIRNSQARFAIYQRQNTEKIGKSMEQREEKRNPNYKVVQKIVQVQDSQTVERNSQTSGKKNIFEKKQQSRSAANSSSKKKQRQKVSDQVFGKQEETGNYLYLQKVEESKIEQNGDDCEQQEKLETIQQQQTKAKKKKNRTRNQKKARAQARMEAEVKGIQSALHQNLKQAQKQKQKQPVSLPNKIQKQPRKKPMLGTQQSKIMMQQYKKSLQINKRYSSPTQQQINQIARGQFTRQMQDRIQWKYTDAILQVADGLETSNELEVYVSNLKYQTEQAKRIALERIGCPISFLLNTPEGMWVYSHKLIEVVRSWIGLRFDYFAARMIQLEKDKLKLLDQSTPDLNTVKMKNTEMKVQIRRKTVMKESHDSQK